MPNTPDPPYRQQLRDTAAALDQQAERLAVLTMRDEDGNIATVAPLGARWQPLPGREGVRIFHVPHWEKPGLFITVSVSEPGSHYAGSVIDESRLLGVVGGGITFNNKAYLPGQFLYVAPGEPSTWSTDDGAVCVIRYDVPPPDIDFSEHNIKPVKP